MSARQTARSFLKTYFARLVQSPAELAGLYSSDAAFTHEVDGQEPSSMNGRDAITQYLSTISYEGVAVDLEQATVDAQFVPIPGSVRGENDMLQIVVGGGALVVGDERKLFTLACILASAPGEKKRLGIISSSFRFLTVEPTTTYVEVVSQQITTVIVPEVTQQQEEEEEEVAAPAVVEEEEAVSAAPAVEEAVAEPTPVVEEAAAAVAEETAVVAPVVHAEQKTAPAPRVQKPRQERQERPRREKKEAVSAAAAEEAAAVEQVPAEPWKATNFFEAVTGTKKEAAAAAAAPAAAATAAVAASSAAAGARAPRRDISPRPHTAAAGAASSTSTGPATTAAPVDRIAVPNDVFVGDLPQTFDDAMRAAVRSAFESFGEIKNLDFRMGHCFVTYATPEQATNCCKAKRVNVNNTQCRVTPRMRNVTAPRGAASSRPATSSSAPRTFQPRTNSPRAPRTNAPAAAAAPATATN